MLQWRLRKAGLTSWRPKQAPRREFSTSDIGAEEIWHWSLLPVKRGRSLAGTIETASDRHRFTGSKLQCQISSAPVSLVLNSRRGACFGRPLVSPAFRSRHCSIERHGFRGDYFTRDCLSIRPRRLRCLGRYNHIDIYKLFVNLFEG